jgi:hypothetical protein
MKIASSDIIVWLIIAGFVAAAKVFSKMQSGSEPDEPPVVPRPNPARPLPRAVRIPPKLQRRPVPAREIETLAEKLARRQAAKNATAPIPPVQSAPQTPEPAATPPPATPSPALTEPASPASIWAEALRDKRNLRNIIISAEIIGPPKAWG